MALGVWCDHVQPVAPTVDSVVWGCRVTVSPPSGTPMVGSGVGGAVSPCSPSLRCPGGRDVTLLPFWGPHVTGAVMAGLVQQPGEGAA